MVRFIVRETRAADRPAVTLPLQRGDAKSVILSKDLICFCEVPASETLCPRAPVISISSPFLAERTRYSGVVVTISGGFSGPSRASGLFLFRARQTFPFLGFVIAPQRRFGSFGVTTKPESATVCTFST